MFSFRHLIFTLIIFSFSTVAQILPIQSGRVDIFISSAAIHKNTLEYLIISIDQRIKAIGRVSTADYAHSTSAQRWEIVGIHKKNKSKKHGNSPMPYSFMLSDWGAHDYNGTCFHGTYDYGYGSFGYRASHGCIRLCTEEVSSSKKMYDAAGLHRLVWKYLNPLDLDQIAHPSSGWFKEDTDGCEAYALDELNERVRIYTHDKNSLAKKEGWKELFEELYSKELILEAVGDKRGNPKTSYKEYIWENLDVETQQRVQLNPNVLNALDALELKK
jgi:hypothetical protein